MEQVPGDFATAISDFHRARSQADLQQILSRLKGESSELLSFDEVRQKLKTRGISDRGLRDIPLSAIVGSVGRYSDFTRDFLPKKGISEERWARVKLAGDNLTGLPPIEVYQIGEVYFVKDGNHRVSVARSLNVSYIQAYVTEVTTRVPLTADIRPDNLILKAEYAEFLEKTRVDELRPEANLELTVPGQYENLAAHIDVHRYFMGIDQQREIPYDEAVTHWYDTVYLPVVQIIREQGILDSFPGRTEGDLYLWIAEHRAALENYLGWDVPPEAAASDLIIQRSTKPQRLAARLSEKILESLSLDTLEPGPPPGQWRREKVTRRTDRLFNEVLVPINGTERGWNALEQAIIIAQREEARLHGLHVLPTEEEATSEAAIAVREQFNQRCAEAGVSGQLVLAAGEVARQVCSRARWADLIVPSLNYPPRPQPLARLSSGFRELIQRCPRPLFAVPEVASLSRALLAYDGSPKAEEALYIATYLAGQWRVPLVVVTVLANGSVTEKTQAHAREYLENHGIEATYVLGKGQAAEGILQTAEAHESDFLIIGGYGTNPVLEVVLGSVVDQVLRSFHKPMLICR